MEMRRSNHFWRRICRLAINNPKWSSFNVAGAIFAVSNFSTQGMKVKLLIEDIFFLLLPSLSATIILLAFQVILIIATIYKDEGNKL